MARILFESGEKNPKAKLTSEDVKEIKTLVASGQLQKDVASKFGVTQPIISDIVNGKIWKEN